VLRVQCNNYSNDQSKPYAVQFTEKSPMKNSNGHNVTYIITGQAHAHTHTHTHTHIAQSQIKLNTII